MLTVRNFVAISCASLALALGGACKKDDKKKKAEPTPAPVAADAAAAKPTPPSTDAAAAPTAATDAGKAAAATPDAGKAATTDPGTKAEPNKGKPTNLEILPKSWSRKRVTSVMKKFKKALGVDCKFCHDTKDYASDKNRHKDIARNMMRMTSALNKKFFSGKGKVSCYTCHKGKKEP